MAAESSESPSLINTRMSTFQFEIKYSKAKNLSIGKSISSPKFTVGVYDWYIQYFPRGLRTEYNGSHASLVLRLQSEVEEEISMECSIQVLGKDGNFTIAKPSSLNSRNKRNAWGVLRFIASNATEELYCVNGVLVVSCSIRLFSDPKVVKTYPGGLCEHIEKLWNKGERFDVTFEVEGECISAHRIILAARSPVFEAELFGPMAEANMKHIKIDEMKAEVFKALLHFVYTDRLGKDGFSDHKSLSVELLHGLFVAADRYGLDKLTLLCGQQLSKNLSVETVATSLLLADRHSCDWLKEKCLGFASSSENFLLVALTDGYLNIMLESPSLLAELSEMVKCQARIAKKQRTG